MGNCGKKVQKSPATRTHACNHCGFVEDRDMNTSGKCVNP
ncbi:MAG: zinc ribbon domain-containing protein [Cuspidothrix sp.]